MGVLTPPPVQGEIALDAVLQTVGITPPLKHTGDSASKTFSDAGAGVDDVAETVARLMKGAENEGVQLQAARFAADVHKLIEKNANAITNGAPEINITIHSQGNTNVTSILGVLMPPTSPRTT